MQSGMTAETCVPKRLVMHGGSVSISPLILTLQNCARDSSIPEPGVCCPGGDPNNAEFNSWDHDVCENPQYLRTTG